MHLTLGLSCVYQATLLIIGNPPVVACGQSILPVARVICLSGVRRSRNVCVELGFTPEGA